MCEEGINAQFHLSDWILIDRDFGRHDGGGGGNGVFAGLIINNPELILH